MSRISRNLLCIWVGGMFGGFGGLLVAIFWPLLFPLRLQGSSRWEDAVGIALLVLYVSFSVAGEPLNLATSVNYAQQIVTVLEIAHDAGVVHGCLRPSAIFVTVDSRIKVLDFGVQAAADARNSIRIAIDPAYLSPEQLRGADWDCRSDFFAFGAVLYEMLAGFSPFRRDSHSETAYSVLRDNPRSLSELNPGIPGSLAALVKNCLAKDQSKRPASARKIAEELESSS